MPHFHHDAYNSARARERGMQVAPFLFRGECNPFPSIRRGIRHVYIPAPAEVRATEREGIGGRPGRGGARVPRVACTTRFPGIALIVGQRRWGRKGEERAGQEGERGIRDART